VDLYAREKRPVNTDEDSCHSFGGCHLIRWNCAGSRPRFARDGEPLLEQQPVPSRSVWEGRIGGTFLRVGVQASGRIEAQWRAKAGNERRAVVNTIDELERSVLFQLMLAAPPDQQGLAGDIAQAVAQAKVGLPDPTQTPRPAKKRKKGGQQRRRRRPGK